MNYVVHTVLMTAFIFCSGAAWSSAGKNTLCDGSVTALSSRKENQEKTGESVKYQLADKLLCEKGLIKSKLNLTEQSHVSAHLQQYQNRQTVQSKTYVECGKKGDVGCSGPTPDGLVVSRKVVRASVHDELLVSYAQQYNIDPYLLMAISQIESGRNSNALSPKGAMGLMQIMPATARLLGHRGHAQELYDPATNIKLACVYLRVLFRRYGNDIPLILAAYNAGEAAVQRYGGNIPPYPETQDYVRRVMNKYVEMRTL